MFERSSDRTVDRQMIDRVAKTVSVSRGTCHTILLDDLGIYKLVAPP
jgi:hypothetical protein